MTQTHVVVRKLISLARLQVDVKFQVIRLVSQNLGGTPAVDNRCAGRHRKPLWVLGECTGLQLTASTRRLQSVLRHGAAALRPTVGMAPKDAQLICVRLLVLQGSVRAEGPHTLNPGLQHSLQHTVPGPWLQRAPTYCTLFS